MPSKLFYNFEEQGNYNNFSGSFDFTVDKKSATVTITLKEDASGITYGTNAEEVKTYVSKVEFWRLCCRRANLHNRF